ncbi:MAG TPA: NAD(P)-binding domain-containing protein [Trebonia sp.]|nr:NAD(P)-binding domain-containing protein [Trebonia sp.]
MQISIVGGSGRMGRGIAARALAGQHAVQIIDRDRDRGAKTAAQIRDQQPGADIQAGEAEAIASADIVVLAVPYPATTQVAARYASLLDGKVVIDIANPFDRATFDPTTSPGTSAAEELAARAPRTRVVKAFNTTFPPCLMSGGAGGQPLDVFIASDDAQARKIVADFAASCGLNPVDVGPLRRARALEAFQILHISLQREMASPLHSAIKILT